MKARHVAGWIAGPILGTLVIAMISPVFVRSYTPEVFDSIRGVWVLPEGTLYRWRAEGHAASRVGPHGMVGWVSLPVGSDTELDDAPERRITLWGDSQAEGVCVNDDDKLWACLQRVGGPGCKVLPLARSGDDGWDWASQMPRVERGLKVTEHLLLICQIDDLLTLADPPRESRDVRSAGEVRRKWLDVVPDFVAHAATGVLREPSGPWRTLRWSFGPVERLSTAEDASASMNPGEIVGRAMGRLRAASGRPITILYAPLVPVVLGDRIVRDDPHAAIAAKAAAVAEELGIGWVDCRDKLVAAVEAALAAGQRPRAESFPHGFDHGRIGSGHLNATGNRIVANSWVTPAMSDSPGWD